MTPAKVASAATTTTTSMVVQNLWRPIQVWCRGCAGAVALILITPCLSFPVDLRQAGLARVVLPAKGPC
jgi:hypothetical protein